MLEIYLLDWLSLAVKFLHIIAGVAWIGASFYFNWLENKLNRVGNKDGIAGHLWAIHGGGFYYLEKQQKYPKQLPKPLHWFKWEAYVTWISGVLLLAIIYYFNASSYLLINDSVISQSYGVGYSLIGLILMWMFYDMLCKASDNPVILITFVVIIITISTYLYGLIFNPRAVFMQIGAMLGTVMVANVFFVIIPVQKKLVKACIDKTEVSKELGTSGYIRSRHNNYFTLPVLFIMISNHYPFVYSSGYNWLVLITMFLVAVLIRHYFNLRGVNQTNNYLIVIIVALILALVVALMPTKLSVPANQETVSLDKVKLIIKARCVSCHSQTPTDDIFKVAPNGFILDTKPQIVANKQLIFARTVTTNSMPFANKTKMTQAERDYLAAWVVSSND